MSPSLPSASGFDLEGVLSENLDLSENWQPEDAWMQHDNVISSIPTEHYHSLNGTTTRSYLVATHLTLLTDFSSFGEHSSQPVNTATSAVLASPIASDAPVAESSAQSLTASESPAAALKRHRNTLAARKYRQKRLDRIAELEMALDAMTRERDELRLRLARQEAETSTLKEMLKLKS